MPHPIIARRTWLWRADSGTVIEALGFAGAPPDPTGRDWLTELGPVQQHATAPATRSNQASSTAIIAVGSVASESTVKSRRSAQSSAARIVSPVPRRSAPAWTRSALRRPR